MSLRTETADGLDILVIADSKIPVPPPGYGGTERMLAHIANGFAAHGHRVTLMAHPASRIDGRVVGYPWAGRRAKPKRVWAKVAFTTLFERELMRRPDLVVANCRIDYLARLKGRDIPLIYRFSHPIESRDAIAVAGIAPKIYTIVAQANSHGAPLKSVGAPFAIVGNCVDLDGLALNPSPEGYLAFLGRLTYDKGVDTAIRVAQATGLPLKIAGNVSDEAGGRAFFEEKVKPALGERIKWIGIIGDERKAEFLGNASALLAPIRWEEPHANIVPEAFACGTPVIAAPRGSMPELIRPGLNGDLATTDEEFVAAIGRIGAIDRAACRADAEERFSRTRIVDAYLALARQLIVAAHSSVSRPPDID